ncbi:MAG: sulfatase [Prolixibacteraceae bacterium]|nr:sulfatase [Prolixibacteraceae bacterium]
MKRFSGLLFLLFLCIFIQAKEKPNIVFILIDDLGWKDVGFMGTEYYETPNIDRLAKGRMIFTQAYANAANCAPTRACLLSGQYSPRHGLFTVGNSDRGKSNDRRLVPVENNKEISLSKITIAEALKPAGYVSAAIGKWHVGNTPQLQGFDIGVEKPDVGFKQGHFKDDGEYLTDRLTDEAVKFIKENKNKPFFLYLAHHAVHTPIQAKNEIVTGFKDKPGIDCHNDATYAAMIQSVDESVARVNQTLEVLGLSENTILIFFSDNGGYGPKTCMKPLRGGKGMYYEGGIREPMFVYWPGKIKPETMCDVPVISTDFYPTFVKLAGAKYPENYPLDGLNISPLFNGGKSLQRDKLFWHFPGYLQAYGALKDESRDPLFRTRPVSVVRKGDWKLLLFHEEWILDGGREKIKTNNSVELYNIKKDIGEKINLCNIEIEQRDELLDDLLNWQKETNASIPGKANFEYKM